MKLNECVFYISLKSLCAERIIMEINTQYTGGYYAGYKSTTKTTTDSSFYGTAGINDTDYTINKMVSEKNIQNQ